MQSKVLAKIEQIARLRVAGVKDSRIAQMLGMSYAGLAQLLQKQYYRDKEAEVRKTLIAQMDKSLLNSRTEILRNDLRDAVPDAVKQIIDTCRNGADMRTRLAASKEILDRDPDGTFRKNAAKPDEAKSGGGLSEDMLNSARSESARAASMLNGVPLSKPGEA